MRAVADIGTHWLDLLGAITGLDVEAVCADLATVHPDSQAAGGQRRDLSGQARRCDRRRPTCRSRPRTMATCCCGSPAALAGVCTSRRSRPAAKTACGSRSPAQRQASPGTASGPTSCGSAIASGPNECLIRDPALLQSAGASPCQLSRRTQRRLSRHVQAAFPRVLWLYRRRRF